MNPISSKKANTISSARSSVSRSGNSRSTSSRTATSNRKSSEKTTPRASADDLIGFLRNNPSAPAILLIIPDFVRRERAATYVLEHWIPTTASAKKPHHSSDSTAPANERAIRSESGVHRYMGGELTSSTIASLGDSAAALSLFCTLEASYVRDIEACSPSIATELLRVVPRFSETHRLLLTAGELPTSHPVKSAFVKMNACIQLDALRGFELHRWLEKELRRCGFRSWEESAVSAIISAAEESPDRAAAMTHQLALFCEGEVLTASDVHTLFIHQTIPGEFDFLDALIAGNVKKCELMISEFFRSGKNQFMLLGLISRSFSNYLAVSTMLEEGYEAQTIKQKLSLSPWAYNKAVSASRRYSPDRLSSVMGALVAIDSRFKNRSISPETLMSQLIEDVGRAGRSMQHTHKSPGWKPHA